MASMLMRTVLRPAACLAAAALFCGAEAKADFFTYTTTPTPGVAAPGGSVVRITPVDSVSPLSGSTLINIADIGVTSGTQPPATDTATINFADAVAITNFPFGGPSASGTINVAGTLEFTRLDTGGEVSIFKPSASTFSTIIGGFEFTLSDLVYAAPTVNNVPVGDGNITGLISSRAVPEPASVVLMGVGGVGLTLMLRRRKGRVRA